MQEALVERFAFQNLFGQNFLVRTVCKRKREREKTSKRYAGDHQKNESGDLEDKRLSSPICKDQVDTFWPAN